MKFLQQCPEPIRPSPTARRDLLPDPKPVQWQINRLVLRNVTRLHHLQENWLFSSAEDLAPIQLDDGELVSPLELIPAPDIQPDHALLQKESFVEFHRLKLRFELFLAKERRLIQLLDLNCDGIAQPKDIAAHLKLGVRTVENLQKRLRRKWRAFSRPRSLPWSLLDDQISAHSPANPASKSQKHYSVTS